MTNSTLIFFGCDHFHPYKRVGWNSSQNYGQFHTFQKKLWSFPPSQKLVWPIPLFAFVTNSICPKRLCRQGEFVLREKKQSAERGQERFRRFWLGRNFPSFLPWSRISILFSPMMVEIICQLGFQKLLGNYVISKVII